MKTRSMIGVAMVAVLSCAAANAQVLGGGGIGGGLGGTLSGGMRDMQMTTQGALNGSFGADLDTSTLGRTTRDTAGRVTDRARNTTSAVRDRATTKVDQTREKIGDTRDTATATTSAAAATAVGAINDVQIEGAADMAGSATSSLSHDGLNVAGNAQGAGSGALSGATLPQPELAKPEAGSLLDNDTSAVSNVTQRVESAKDTAPAQTAEPSKGSSGSASGSGLLAASNSSQLTKPAKASDSTTGSGLLNASNATKTAEPAKESEPAKTTQPTRGLSLSGDANGSASASRKGVSADGNGSANVSRN